MDNYAFPNFPHYDVFSYGHCGYQPFPCEAMFNHNNFVGFDLKKWYVIKTASISYCNCYLENSFLSYFSNVKELFEHACSTVRKKCECNCTVRKLYRDLNDVLIFVIFGHILGKKTSYKYTS